MGEAEAGWEGWGTQSVEGGGEMLAGTRAGLRGGLWTPIQTLHPCPPQAAEQTEPCYANLELQTRPLSGKPVQPTRVEVEYSTVVSARAQLPSRGLRAMAEASPCGVRQAGRGERLDWSPCASAERGYTENQSSVGDASGGPVAKTWPSNAGGAGLIPGWGARVPHAS